MTTVSPITSDPLKLCFCVNGLQSCSENVMTISVRRGELFSLSVVAVGQKDMPVPTTIQAYLRNSDETALVTPGIRSISGICTNISFQLFTQRETETLILYAADGPCGNRNRTRLQIYVTLTQCSPGFYLEIDRCVCEKRLLAYGISCYVNTSQIERLGGSWISPLFDEYMNYTGIAFHPNCPLNYCRPASEQILLHFSPNASDTECSPNRMGVLCGNCTEGHSLTLSKFDCKVCSNRYISLLLFFVLAGIALIALLLLLHMTVAAGTINGLILYANIVNVNDVIFFPLADTNILTKSLKVFIAWINLDFGIDTCFYNGLDFYSYAWLNYVFPFYLWFLISVIIFSSRFSTKVGKLFGSNPVAVLATIILLSYTKLLQTVILTLSHTSIEYPDGDKRVWLFDGNVPYISGKHALLSVVAFCIIFFLLFPYFFLLMLGYHLQAYSHKKAFSWLNKFKPLLDAYYAPYRKNMRYWTGFMLLVRSCLYIVFTFSDSSADLVAMSSVFTAILLIPWLSSRIYEKLYNDILEASFLLNICLLSIATYYVKTNMGNTERDVQTIQRNQAIVTYLSVAIAFLQFLGIVAFHAYLRQSRLKFRACISAMKQKFHFNTKKKTIENLEVQRYTSTVVELRESLLEYESSQGQ